MAVRARTILVGLVAALVVGDAPRPAVAQARAANAAGAARPDAPETFVHESWTVKDGLPVNAITGLLQSRDGYIWISTFDGLVRFDGVRFTVFNSANSEGLPTNRIGRFLEARDGALWLLTEQLQLVRFKDGTFTHVGPSRGLSERVFAFVPDSSGTLWIGTERGVGRLVGDRFVPVPGAWGVGGTVRTIVHRADGTTWAGTADGWLFRIAGGRATVIAAGSELAHERVLLLHEDAQRTLWIGTNAGLWRWRGAAERVLRTEEQLGLGFRTSPRTGELWMETPFRAYRVTDGKPVPIVEFPDAIYGGGILLPDEEGRMLLAAGPDLYREGTRLYSLDADGASARDGSAWVGAALIDHEGSLWLGTRAAGLHRLKRAPFRVYGTADGLADRNVYSVYEARDGAVWVGSFDGHTTRIGPEGVTNSRVSRAGSYWIKSILQDRAGRLWVGDATGVQLCALPAMRCARPASDPIGAASVHAIHEDTAGALWFGSDAGLFRLDDAGWRRWSEAEGAPPPPVRVFQQTRDGALWMGTAGGGLARHHRGRFRRVTTADGLPFDHVRSLHEDADGWLWVGTEGRGLARLDPRAWGEAGRRGRIVTVRARDGLFDEVIHQILPDDFGRLWMSTNRGIFWVDRRELLAFADGRVARIHSTGYTERDGLRNREANGGSQPAGTRTRDGRLWFPTQDGVAVVDPSRIRGNRVAPPVAIEQVVAGGTARRPGAEALSLGTTERDLQIDYTALSFLAPSNVRFRYRLAPYDAGWVDAGSRRTAFYTRVPPGRYTFRVIASNNDGVWNEQGAALALVLAPHLWETPTFRLLALLAAGLLTMAGVQWRVRSLRARTVQLGRFVDERTRELREREAQLESRNAQLAELHEARSRLFANASHEFRTPLTLILGPLRGLVDGRHGALPAAVHAQLELAVRNGQRLLRLVNQVLDLARLQAGAVALDRATYDLLVFARATTLAFVPLAERRGVTLRFVADASALPGAFDVEQLEKVLLNLLSNALKFTEPGGAVVVTVARDGDHATIAVRDTGVGIAPEQLPRVFERFYQADASATRRYEGTGIGLALARELVELHGGEIRAESVLGAGSTFVVRLPLGAAMPAFVGAALPPASTAVSTAVRSAELDALTPALAPAAPEAGLPITAPDEDRTTVLVVDDNPDLRTYVRSILAPTYRVIEAADGRAGLEAARAALPDLVIADVMMPELDGLALARALKGDPMTDAIPVVLLTARATTEDQIAGLDTGADAYVVKPFEPAVLEARVANQLAQRRRLREHFRRGAPEPPVAPSVASPAAPPATPLDVPSALGRRLRPIVEARLTDPALSPDTLAAAAGLSYHQLYRALRDELGVSPSRFIRGVRVECAAERLRRGAGSVTEVAYSVGFESLSYFSRAFHERFGAPPSTFLAAAGGASAPNGAAPSTAPAVPQTR